MRKAFLSTMMKNIPRISLILLLIASMALVVVSKPANAQELPIISLNPTELVVPAPGQNFTVDVNITDVTSMQGYEFKLWFNTTILNATDVVAGPINPPGTILGPVDPVTYEWSPLQNVSDGFVWVIGAFPLGQAFSGSGIMMTINFTALAIGDSTLHLNETVLGNPLGLPIDHVTLDGFVTVGAVPPLSLISLNPLESTVLVGDNFTIDVNITDVADLRAWEFKLDYNTTILDAIEVIYEGRITENNTDWLPVDGEGNWAPINDTIGRVWVGALFPLGQEFTGNGTLVTINFTATEVGNCALHLYDTALNDSMGDPIDHETLDGSVTVLPKIRDFHIDHLNDPTDDFPNDYAPMVIPVNGKDVTIAPVITDTNGTGEPDLWKPHYHPCKMAQTFFVDDDWSDKDANYTYIFEDWTDYDWNDIVVSLYTITDSTIKVEFHLQYREAGWKNPFSVEITPRGMAVRVHWNSTDYPGDHIVTVNSDETVDIELFAESNPSDISFIMMITLIPPTASFVYSPLEPEEGQTVTFDASASTPDGGTIVSYDWNFGDGRFGTGKIVNHTYTTAGIYTVTLNVTNSEGIWDTESKQITVKPELLLPPVGGYALPININIDASNLLAPLIALVLAFPAAMAITTILIRRRNKNLKRRH